MRNDLRRPIKSTDDLRLAAPPSFHSAKATLFWSGRGSCHGNAVRNALKHRRYHSTYIVGKNCHLLVVHYKTMKVITSCNFVVCLFNFLVFTKRDLCPRLTDDSLKKIVSTFERDNQSQMHLQSNIEYTFTRKQFIINNNRGTI